MLVSVLMSSLLVMWKRTWCAVDVEDCLHSGMLTTMEGAAHYISFGAAIAKERWKRCSITTLQYETHLL